MLTLSTLKRPSFAKLTSFVAVAGVATAGVASMVAPAGAVNISGCEFDDSVANVWSLTGDCTVTEQITVPAGVTIEGNDYTISGSFAKTDNDNNSILGLTGADDVTINNLTIDGTGSLPWPNGLHGVNVYEASNVTLNDVTIENMSYSGLHVNGSNVTVNNLSTAGNGWHGANVDQGGGVSEPSVLTINGTSSHTDQYHVYIDDTSKDVTVNDTEGQYSVSYPSLNDRPSDKLYTLNPVVEPEDTVAPDAVINSPTDGATVQDEVTLEATVTDDEDLQRYYYYVAAADGTRVVGPETVEVSGTEAMLSQTVDVSMWEDGEYFFQVEARDAAGNKDAGSVARVAFTVDNIVVAAAKDDCKRGGWQEVTRTDGSSFKNQGQCIAYVVSSDSSKHRR